MTVFNPSSMRIQKLTFQREPLISAVTVIHRIGKLLPSDQIVFVGVASKHRQDSFDACNFVMDWLKTQAPFWKIEDDGNKKKWVEFNSLDNDAIKKWKI